MQSSFFLICIVGGGVQTGSIRHIGHLLAYCTCPGWLWGWRMWWNEWQGKPKYSEKTCPDTTSSTTNPTRPDTGLNPGRRGGKPATNRFSYGAAYAKQLQKGNIITLWWYMRDLIDNILQISYCWWGGKDAQHVTSVSLANEVGGYLCVGCEPHVGNLDHWDLLV
jgi:hypothetical protein